MVGIHIRRTDFNQHIEKYHSHLKSYVNDKYFLDLINGILTKEPKQKIFLATDNLKTQKYFKNLFPNNIVLQKTIIPSKIEDKQHLKNLLLIYFV